MPAEPSKAVAADALLILMSARAGAEAAALLTDSGVTCRICVDLDALCAEIKEDAGAVLVADEVLTKANLRVISDRLSTQPPWSDLPFIVLTQTTGAAGRTPMQRRLPEALANFVLLEHPLSAISLITDVQAALRARRRQRQMGAYLAEQSTTAAALRESEARFRHMADSAPALIWMTDAAGHVVFMNMHHTHVFGDSAAGIVREGWEAIIVPEARTHFRDVFRAAFQGRVAFSTETRVHDKAGQVRWLRCDGVPRLDDHKRFLGYTGCGVDITDTRVATQELEHRVQERTMELSMTLEQLKAEVQERERVEDALRQSQKMEAIGQLTGGIAHDFNNMLQGILGCLDLIDRRVAQGRALEVGSYAEAARRSLMSASALTHRLLAFGRRQTLLPRPVVLDTLVRSMEDLIRRTVGPAIKLVLHMRDGGLDLRCDANQLENALLNLCINARDAMPDGGTLTIRTADRTMSAGDLRDQNNIKPGQFVELCVGDTGVGMTPAVMARAFEPFYTTKPLGQGTGLGLSQLYGFVQQSGGFVRLRSKPGAGTTACLHFPRYVEDNMIRAGTTRAATAGASTDPATIEADGSTILVVEDEPDVRSQITQALRDLDYLVVEAADGNIGLRVVQSQQPIDLLLTDVGLPGLNGRQLADAARARRPNLPVLLMTGYPGKALADIGIPPGMAVMGKPFTLDALITNVKTMLGPAKVEVG